MVAHVVFSRGARVSAILGAWCGAGRVTPTHTHSLSHTLTLSHPFTKIRFAPDPPGTWWGKRDRSVKRVFCSCQYIQAKHDAKVPWLPMT